MLIILAAPIIIKNSCTSWCVYLDGQLGALNVGNERNGILHSHPPCDVALGDGGGGTVKPHRQVDH